MDFKTIDTIRKEQRYTIVEFCKQVGIDRTTYYNYMENPDSIKLSTLRKMFEVLGMSKKDQIKVLT